MGKVSTNNYQKAFDQAKAFEESKALKEGTLTSSIPEQIEEREAKNHYHVMLIKNRHDANNERYVSSANVQTFAKGRAFDKIAKNFNNQGFAAAIIVHDPTQYSDGNDGALKLHEKSAIEVQIEKEEKAAMEKRIADRKQEALDKAQAEKKAQEVKDAEEAAKAQKGESFETATVVNAENVDALAKEHKIDISKATTPAGKIAIVQKSLSNGEKK